MKTLSIGNRSVNVHQAEEWVSSHTSKPSNPKKPFGYPWYDTYDTGTSDEIVDGDLLAPTLLNVRIPIATYQSLKSISPTLNRILAEIPPDTSLLATNDLGPISRLYATLDSDPRPFGVKATVLAKVLHRKRPDFIPLYDKQIRRCYSDPFAGAPATIKNPGDLSWAEFMTVIASSIRTDILNSISEWDDLQGSNQGDTKISLLRCFDIVAWNCGKLIAEEN